jgi:hypothetical protein
MKNLSFSVLMDKEKENSEKDNKKQITNISSKIFNLDKIYPKITGKWIDSNLIVKCQLCSIAFTLFIRKHHCRACGRVFCYKCCNKYITIPKDYITCPQEDDTYKKHISNIKSALYLLTGKTQKSENLVCIACHNKIKNLNEMLFYINILEFVDLKSLYDKITICKKWHNATIYYLSKFREIQYKGPVSMYNKWEIGMLINSKKILANHNIWMVHIIKSILQSYYLDNKHNNMINFFDNKNKNKNESCMKSMCTRCCGPILTILNFIEILKFLIILENKNELLWKNSCYLLKIFIKNIIFNLAKPNDIIVEIIMPIYVSLLASLCSSLDNIDKDFINILLDYICIKQNTYFILMDEIRYLKSLKNSNKTMGMILLSEIVDEYISNKIEKKEHYMIEHMIKELINLSTINNYIPPLPIKYPLDYCFNIVSIENIQIINSNSRPKIITATIANELKSRNIQFIIKNDIGMRKEQIAASLIKTVQYRLHIQTIAGKLKSSKDIPTYNIKMITDTIGIIEFVENSVTLRSIHESGLTLQNYILELNIEKSLSDIRTKFSQSLALSSCISYFMCLGDRHMDNIMINAEGQIFHIDYGYLMSFPPYTVLNTSNIKITTAMVDLLGGVNSQYYNYFFEYTIELYDNIRLFRNIIMIFYEEITINSDLDWKIVEKKLHEKFMVGLSKKNIKTVLANEITTSTMSYTNIANDFYFYYKKQLIG